MTESHVEMLAIYMHALGRGEKPPYLVAEDGSYFEAPVVPAAQRFGRQFDVRRVFPAVYTRTAGRCFYCGFSQEDLFECFGLQREMEIDHFVPRARGGPTALWNLVLSCDQCNREKGSLTIDGYRRKLAGARPTRSSWLFDFENGDMAVSSGLLTEDECEAVLDAYFRAEGRA